MCHRLLGFCFDLEVCFIVDKSSACLCLFTTLFQILIDRVNSDLKTKRFGVLTF